MDDPTFAPAHELARSVREGEISSRELLDALRRPDRAAQRRGQRRRHPRPRAGAGRGGARRRSARPRRRGRAAARPADHDEGRDRDRGHPLDRRRDRAHRPRARRRRRRGGAWKAAGAIVFGKTNVPRWSGDLQTYNEIFGTTNNPWALDRVPGGSSGGAATSVACGFTSFEIGTDIGGSVRIPSHCCGVFGLKPSFGVVPQRGYLDHVGGGTTDADINVFGPIAQRSRSRSPARRARRSRRRRRRRLAARAATGAVRIGGRPARRRVVRRSVRADRPRVPRAPGRGGRSARRQRREGRRGASARRLRRAGAPVQRDDPARDLAVARRRRPRRRVGKSPAVAPAGGAARGVSPRLGRMVRAARPAAVPGHQRARVRARPHRRLRDPHDHDQRRVAPLHRSRVVDGADRHRRSPFGRAPDRAHRAGIPVGMQMVGGYLRDRDAIAGARIVEDLLGGFTPPPHFV